MLSLVIRIAFVSTLDREGFYFIDTSLYDKAAVNLIKDRTFGTEYERPPVYPVFLASVYLFSYRNLLLVRIVQSVLGSLICILIFMVGKGLYETKTAFFASLISAFYPVFVFTSGILYPVILATLWLLLVVIFLLRGRETGALASCSLAGLFMGLAILTKPMSIVLFGLLVLYLLATRGTIKSNKIVSVMLFVLCTFLVTSTWVIRNYRVRGEVSIIESNRRVLRHLTLSYSRKKAESPPEEERLVAIFTMLFQRRNTFIKDFTSEAIHFWKLYPDRVQSREASKRRSFKSRDTRLQTTNPYVGDFTKYLSIISFGPILAFSILGLVFSVRKGRRIFLLVSPILSFCLGYSIFLTKFRYRIPIEPFLIILAAFGLTTTQTGVFGYIVCMFKRKLNKGNEASLPMS